MSYAVIYRRQPSRYLERLSAKERDRIISAIERLADDPSDPTLDVKKLTERSGYRLRVGRYRVIFDRNDSELVITVIRISPRGDAYKG